MKKIIEINILSKVRIIDKANHEDNIETIEKIGIIEGEIIGIMVIQVSVDLGITDHA